MCYHEWLSRASVKRVKGTHAKGNALFGIGGIICAVFANKQGKTGLAKGGLICSIVGIVLGILITVHAVVFSMAMVGYGFESMY